MRPVIELMHGVVVALSLFTAYLALRLRPLTGANAAWSRVALALLLVGITRFLELANFAPVALTDSTRLVGWTLLCAGVWSMRAHFIAAARDLAERRRAEEALRESERRFQSFFENTSLGMYRSTPEGRVVMANPAFLRIVGCASADDLHELDLVAREAEGGYLRRPFLIAMERDGAVQGLETNWRRKDGSVVVLRENARAIRDVEGRVLLYEGTVEDITERRRFEERLAQSQKMEAIGRLAGGVAHDFNNILTAIVGYGELLRMGLAPDDPNRPSVDQIVRAGDRAAALTRQLLAFSRKDMCRPRVIDVNDLVREVTPMLERMVGEDVRLRAELRAAESRILADPLHVEQVLLNLAANARDAMPKGGTLTIATGARSVAPNHRTGADEARAGEYVVLAVTDSGVGMGRRTLAHIFEPFFTTKAVGQGTGLGLASVYGIVRQNHGFIEVDSTVGRGTTFRIHLPLVAAECIADAQRNELADDLPRGSEKILLAEDDDGVRELARQVLEALGYEVFDAASAEEALGPGAPEPSSVRLLVSDVVMPGMNGRELYGELGRRGYQGGVLFISGYTDDAIVRLGVRDGDVPLLHKPFPPADLARRVREVLDAHAAPAAPPAAAATASTSG